MRTKKNMLFPVSHYGYGYGYGSGSQTLFFGGEERQPEIRLRSQANQNTHSPWLKREFRGITDVLIYWDIPVW